MKHEDLKKMIMEELDRIREERGFAGLEISALNDVGEEVVRMTWAREPAVEVAEQTLLAQLELPTVKRLMVHKGEEWIEANLPALDQDIRIDYPEEEPRFSPEQEEQDARLENPDLYRDED